MPEIIIEAENGRLILDGHGIRSEGLKENCPKCGQPECYEHTFKHPYEDRPDEDHETLEETADRRAVNSAIDGVESLVLAMVEGGAVSPHDHRLRKAVEVALDAIGNNLG